MWSFSVLSVFSISAMGMVLGFCSVSFFWFLVVFEMFVLYFMTSLMLFKPWFGFVLIFLSIFCLEAAFGMSLLTYYVTSKFKVSVGVK